MAYRFVNPAPVFFDVPGTELANGGFLHFYETGTTTNKTTYSDTAGTIPNANPVPLDSSGRANTSIWLSGNYTVVLKDSLGATVWTRDIQPEAAAGTILPALVANNFLTNNGSIMSWDSVRQVPDPTGSANKLLSTDGTALMWIAQAAATTATGGKLDFGSSMIQWGTGVFPASVSTPAHYSTVTITFPTAFSAPPGVFAIAQETQILSPGNGHRPIVTVSAPSTTTVVLNGQTNEVSTDPAYNWINACNVFWFAVGLK